MMCFRDDRAPFPGSSGRWFYSYLDNGQEGYLWAPQVANQTPGIPNCAGINWIQVSDWSIGHLGQTYAASPEAARFTAADWSPGPVGEWQGDCAKFTFLAWDGHTARGNAIDAYRYYADRGQVRRTRPPRGALVFYNRTSFGHIAISIGNWQAIGTTGLDNQSPIQPVSRYSVNTSDYLGWAMPQAPNVAQNPS